MNIMQTILNLKVGYLILIVGGLLLVGSLIKNILYGSFSLGKFVSGFNPFTGSIQGKLIWLAIWCFIFFTVYQFIMRPTTNFDTDYKNNVHHNDDVIIDERVGNSGCVFEFGWGLIKLGCQQKPIISNINEITEKDKVIDQRPKIVIPEKVKEQPKKLLLKRIFFFLK